MSITRARELTRPIWSKADLVLSVRLVYVLKPSRRIWLRYRTFCGRSIQLQSLVAGVNTSSAVVQAEGMLKGFGVCGRIRTILWPGVYK